MKCELTLCSGRVCRTIARQPNPAKEISTKLLLSRTPEEILPGLTIFRANGPNSSKDSIRNLPMERSSVECSVSHAFQFFFRHGISSTHGRVVLEARSFAADAARTVCETIPFSEISLSVGASPPSVLVKIVHGILDLLTIDGKAHNLQYRPPRRAASQKFPLRPGRTLLRSSSDFNYFCLRVECTAVSWVAFIRASMDVDDENDSDSVH